MTKEVFKKFSLEEKLMWISGCLKLERYNDFHSKEVYVYKFRNWHPITWFIYMLIPKVNFLWDINYDRIIKIDLKRKHKV